MNKGDCENEMKRLLELEATYIILPSNPTKIYKKKWKPLIKNEKEKVILNKEARNLVPVLYYVPKIQSLE